MFFFVSRYGPFWISTTLVFVSAVTGNYANYVSYKRQHSSEATGPLTSWYYDVDKARSSLKTPKYRVFKFFRL